MRVISFQMEADGIKIYQVLDLSAIDPVCLDDIASVVSIAAAGFCVDLFMTRCEPILGRSTTSSLKPKVINISTLGFKSKAKASVFPQF
ncbi:hypothetical protein [Shewanella surugensis]|uniref:Uncharacterized protein n=1 Tax=Shewanella surugensis TaxID=212020 RepID=A0ABT0L6Y3_9GAMM|nr:hypothetical protein [Shewanella surugensis]MCL1123145.1 hypothetical protein [Shewanella surugensis]